MPLRSFINMTKSKLEKLKTKTFSSEEKQETKLEEKTEGKIEEEMTSKNSADANKKDTDSKIEDQELELELEQKQETTTAEEKEGEAKNETSEKATSISELEKLSNEARDLKGKYLNTLAESENARKRFQKERKNIVKHAVQDFSLELLAPLDHFETALSFADNMSDEIKNWAVGFKMIHDQLRNALTRQGIKPFCSKEKQFDPYFHEAIETVETEEFPEGTIVEEILKGYKIGDSILRPAKVKVAKPKKKEEPAKEETSEEKDSKETTDESTNESKKIEELEEAEAVEIKKEDS